MKYTKDPNTVLIPKLAIYAEHTLDENHYTQLSSGTQVFFSREPWFEWLFLKELFEIFQQRYNFHRMY